MADQDKPTEISAVLPPSAEQLVELWAWYKRERERLEDMVPCVQCGVVVARSHPRVEQLIGTLPTGERFPCARCGRCANRSLIKMPVS